MKGRSAATGEAAGWARKASMRTGESAVRTGEATTAVRSATTMLRKRSAAGPNNQQRDHHRNRSETLHEDILRPFGKLRTGERAQASSPSERSKEHRFIRDERTTPLRKA
jgi:hypothetical protein